MSAKNVDRHNRFRSITVGFRVSPEEQEELNRAVALSGLPSLSNRIRTQDHFESKIVNNCHNFPKVLSQVYFCFPNF